MTFLSFFPPPHCLYLQLIRALRGAGFTAGETQRHLTKIHRGHQPEQRFGAITEVLEPTGLPPSPSCLARVALPLPTWDLQRVKAASAFPSPPGPADAAFPLHGVTPS